jgi:two-component system, sensor histidine kinase and response regulator
MTRLKLNRLATSFVVLTLMAMCLNGFILLYVLKLHLTTISVQENRQQALKITYDIQQETFVLSQMVRAYTTSANTKYLRYYYDIIDIRQGNIAPPENYDSTYWSKVMAGERIHAMSKDLVGISLLERMKLNGFSKEEFDAIDRVLFYSNKLFEQDQIAFAATQGLYDPDLKLFVDDGKPQLKFANQFVYSDDYLKLENALAEKVKEFAELTNERTKGAVQIVTSQLQHSIYAAIMILVCTVIIILIAVGVIQKMVLAPMKHLMANASALGSGNYNTRAEIRHSVDEIQALGQTFNSMARNIQEDILQREQIQEKLEIASNTAEESTRTKSLFLANMSHEIRTPMNAIIGMTYLALNSHLDDRQRDYIGKIQEAAQSLLGIINDILDFSKIEAEKLVIEQVRFQIEDVISNSLILLRQRALEKGIELLLEIKNPQLLGDARTFLGDPLRIGQVLTNLLSNAVKFTGKGHVKLSVDESPFEEDRSILRLLVEDTGIGMDPEQIQKLFREFSQVDGSTTRKFGGTGLGLSISKKLIALMKGQISVSSQPGKGTQFICTLTLPRAAHKPQQSSFPTVNFQGLKALIIDNNEPAILVLRTLLGHFGVESVGVTSGVAALALLAQSDQSFDIILIDWIMPHMNGNEVLGAMRELSFRKQPAFVAISAYDFDKNQTLDEQQNICHFLPKPILPKDIRRLLHEIHYGRAPDVTLQTLSEAPHLQGMRVLLIEDNLVNQQIATELLNFNGVQVDIANNGKEGVEKVNSMVPDYYHAILMDIQLPVMDGYEATRILRRQPQYQFLPIIAMTAHAMLEEQQRCKAEGMNAHIAKPIEPDSLYRMLATYYVNPEDVSSLQQTRQADRDLRRTEDYRLPHDVPGMDTETGLLYCSGRPEIFIKALKGYVKHYSGLARRLHALSEEEQWDDIANLAHSFASLSATIGIPDLQTLGRQIEGAGRKHPQDMKQLIMQLEESLPPVTDALHRFLNQYEASQQG